MKVKTTEIIDEFEELILERLAQKPNWGINQVTQEITNAKIDLLSTLLDSMSAVTY